MNKIFLLLISISMIASAQLGSALSEDRNSYLKYFQSAADEFHVPVDVLKGISFAETRWSQLRWAPGDTASCMGMPHPYGIMSLWDNDFFGHSLQQAAALIGEDVQTLKDDPLQNIRGAAVLLRKLYDSIPIPEETSPSDIESWRNAIAAFSKLPRVDYAQQHALDVYTSMNEGYHNYGINFDAHPVKLTQIRTAVSKIFQQEALRRSALQKTDETTNTPDYPGAKWAQAYLGHWYTTGISRSFVVEHDMEGYYLSVITYFQQSTTQASIHYCVNSLSNGSDSHGHVEPGTNDAPIGEITQMVEEKYWAWHVVCWNRYMFGIEHEGFVNDPAWYTEGMYQASAKLTSYLCDKYGIPKDRNHIIGHNEWQNASWKTWMASNWSAIDLTCNNHTDPGQYWNWNHYMELVTMSDTIAPVVVSSFPGGALVPAYKNITVTFNTSMDAASTNAAFSISPTVAGTISWNSDKSVMTFHPASFLPFGTLFTVTIDTSAKNISTKKAFQSGPFQFTFTTVPTDSTGPVVIQYYPHDNDQDVSSSTDIVFTMNEPVDQVSLAGRVNMYDDNNNPLVLSNAKNDTLNDRGIISFSSSGIKPNSTYTVTLLGGIKDYYGNAANDSVVIHFTTTNRIVSPGIIADAFESNLRSWVQPTKSAGTQFVDSNRTTFVFTTEKKFNGNYSGKLSYAFTGDSGGVVVERLTAIPSIDSYSRLGVWVSGDQSMNTFLFRFTPDSQIVAMGPVSWRGWKFLEVNLDSVHGTNKKIDAFIVKQEKGASTFGALFFDDMQLNATISGVPLASVKIPDGYTLFQNYPNPFNPSTTIRYTLGSPGFVSLKIFNVLGEEVATLKREVETAGIHFATFDASRFSSGVYFYTLRSGSFTQTEKMLLVK